MSSQQIQSSLQRVLRAVENVTGTAATPNGDDYLALCPAHDDHKPSLSIKEGEDQRVLLHCRAGCKTTSVVAALGLTMRDLFAAPSNSKVPVATYSYTDANGDEVFQKLRYHPKKFRQRRRHPDGSWVWGLTAGWYEKVGEDWRPIKGAHDKTKQPHGTAIWMDSVPKLLYNLPAVAAAVTAKTKILFVEGEKDVETLRELGYTATTNPGGAGEKWCDEYGNQLRNADVILIPDNDDPGRKHGKEYAENLLNCACDVKSLDLPNEFKDISDWIKAGNGKPTLDILLTTAKKVRLSKTVQLLDNAPDILSRPLQIVRNRAYAATWVYVSDGDSSRQTRLILREDGAVFGSECIEGVRPLSELSLQVELKFIPQSDRLMSGAGVKRFICGDKPNPATVFRNLQQLVNTFVDFGRSIGSQEVLVELFAVYTLATYFLDAFPVFGYLWTNGPRGTGKTTAIAIIADLGYLGQLLLSGGTYASLRDLADYGAVLAFDDAEVVSDTQKCDQDKRALMLAGNRKGAKITVKEEKGREWVTRHVQAYSPRAFSSIRQPEPVLASRSITIPMARSADTSRTKTDFMDYESWPLERQPLIDALWALGTSHQRTVHSYEKKARTRARLTGRDLEPWRAIFAVALWLQEEHGITGSFDRMEDLAVDYQSQRWDVEEASPERVMVLVLCEMAATTQADPIEAIPGDIAERMNLWAVENEAGNGNDFTSSRKVGHLLKIMRFRRRARKSGHKCWEIRRDDLAALATAYSVATTTQAATPTTTEQGAVCADGADGAEGAEPVAHDTNFTVNGAPRGGDEQVQNNGLEWGEAP